MYNDRALIFKQEVVIPVPGFMIHVDLFQGNEHVINFITDEMTSKFELFSKKKMDSLYLT